MNLFQQTWFALVSQAQDHLHSSSSAQYVSELQMHSQCFLCLFVTQHTELAQMLQPRQQHLPAPTAITAGVGTWQDHGQDSICVEVFIADGTARGVIVFSHRIKTV